VRATTLPADSHPLAHLLAVRGMTAESYLRRVADQHARMGYGRIASRPEKLSRWVRRGYTPTHTTQLAMAALEGIRPETVQAHGWPGWLHQALPDDTAVLTAPWTTTGTLHALEITGGPVDRRKFLITTPATLSGITAQWVAARPAEAADAHGRRVGADVPAAFECRLDALRHLDDQMGSGQVYDAVLAEQRMITSTLKTASYSEAVGQRLWGAAAEASRSAGWTAYDSGKLAAADRHYTTALRAAAHAGDPVVGINTLAFWAIAHYSTGDPRGAVGLIETALGDAPTIGSARMTAMLHARACRAHARAGDARAADQAATAAVDTYAQAAPIADDPSCVYWVNQGVMRSVNLFQRGSVSRRRYCLAA
jgi:hypothetical protein